MARLAALLFATPGALLLPLAPSPADAAPGPKVYTVTIDKMKFGALPSGLRVGDRIIWVNKDMFRHSATARDKSFDVDLEPGKSARMVVRKPGAIAFFCRFHPGMTGALQVGR